jgi:hypothetical protein
MWLNDRKYNEYYFNINSGDLIAIDDKTNIFSRLIKFFTKGDINHVGIVYRDKYNGHLLYESLWEQGCVKTRLEEFVNKKKNNSKKYKIYVYHLKKPLSDFEEEVLITDLNNQLGKQYSVLQAMFSAIDHVFVDPLRKLGLPIGKPRVYNSKLFCSKLVTIALKKVNRLDANIIARYQTPAEVIKAECYNQKRVLLSRVR